MKMPLSVEDQQSICDDANPLLIPSLVDTIARLQDLLQSVSRIAHERRSDSLPDIIILTDAWK